MNEYDSKAANRFEEETSNGASNHSQTPQPDDLHDLFGKSDVSEEEDPLADLRNDPNYSALIRDLEYIAAQARLLFTPAEEVPSDEVWKKIQTELSKDVAE